MKLRTRFAVILAVFVLALVALAVGASQFVLVRYAIRQDEENVRATLQRGLHLLADARESLLSTTKDWAWWDDTYTFIADRNEGYIESNIVDGTLRALGLNLIAFIDVSGACVLSKHLGVEEEESAAVLAAAASMPPSEENDSLVTRVTDGASESGLLSIDDVLWCVAAAPILTSDEKGPPRGAVLMARKLDGAEIARLGELVHGSLHLIADGAVFPSEELAVQITNARKVAGRAALRDIGGKVVFMEITMSRVAFAQSIVAVLYLAGWILLCGSGIALIAFWILDRWVLQELTASVAALESGIVSIASADRNRPRLRSGRADEMGRLAEAINTMLTAFEVSQDRLRGSEERYRGLVESSTDALAGLDDEGRILFANRMFLRWVGEEWGRDAVGRSIAEAPLGDPAPVIAARLRELPETASLELGPLVARADGADRWVIVVLSRIPSFGSDAGYVLACLRDVTRRVLAEREAERRRAEAVQAQKLAALGTLVAGVAHEVNNPNGIVNLNMNVLQRQLKSVVASDAVRKELDAVVAETLDASRRIALLISSLKSFARPAGGQMAEAVDINGAIRHSCEWLRHEMDRRHCRVELALADALPTVRGNAQQLQQVFINLLENAFAAAGRPGMAVRVVSSFEASARAVTIRVEDEGKGIPPENIDRVLDPFFTTRRDEGGTGLGLSISAAIIKAHAGTLGVESELNKGTRVTVTLPVAEGDVP